MPRFRGCEKSGLGRIDALARENRQKQARMENGLEKGGPVYSLSECETTRKATLKEPLQNANLPTPCFLVIQNVPVRRTVDLRDISRENPFYSSNIRECVNEEW